MAETSAARRALATCPDGLTEGQRPAVRRRGGAPYVATRQGLESFKRQLYAEALQRGLLEAETVLVLGDGAVWIWKLAADTFSNATQRLDLYHAKEHLWTLAGELYGKGSPEADAWVRPYLRWLEQRNDGALDVIRSIEDLQRTLNAFDEKQQKALAREVAYLIEHKDRMNGLQAGQEKGAAGRFRRHRVDLFTVPATLQAHRAVLVPGRR